MNKQTIITAIMMLFLLWFFLNQSKFTGGGKDKGGNGKGGH